MGSRWMTHSRPRPKPLGTATAMAGFWWDSRSKTWHVRIEHQNGTVVMRRIHTSADIGQTELWMLLGAIDDEMCRWLA